LPPGICRHHVEAGGTVGLPVVVQDAAPVDFWRWRPAVALKRGHWNIPVPPERDGVIPDVLVVPLVGFDAGRYRLGYGGGFYDRTLAAATPRLHTIGIAFADAELPTIYPQPHDIPMDVIITDSNRFLQ
jgi:5-formyltetrahydrofolate cyclo-ligase